MKHECAHAWAGLVAGAETATVYNDGVSWRTFHKWPTGTEPTELQVMTGYLVAPLLFPDHASAEDMFLLEVFGAVRPEAMEEIRTIATEVILPAIAATPKHHWAAWCRKVDEGRALMFARRTGHH